MKVQQFVLIANWLKPSYHYILIEIFVSQLSYYNQKLYHISKKNTSYSSPVKNVLPPTFVLIQKNLETLTMNMYYYSDYKLLMCLTTYLNILLQISLMLGGEATADF